MGGGGGGKELVWSKLKDEFKVNEPNPTFKHFSFDFRQVLSCHHLIEIRNLPSPPPWVISETTENDWVMPILVNDKLKKHIKNKSICW